jgi:hypothetical protein
MSVEVRHAIEHDAHTSVPILSLEGVSWHRGRREDCSDPACHRGPVDRDLAERLRLFKASRKA